MAEVAQTRVKDGVAWPIGTASDVGWIADDTGPGLNITRAIPPVFADYATLAQPGEGAVPRNYAEEDKQDRALLALLQSQTTPQSWWLGYLDTGASDIVFRDAPKVTLYTGWNYVLVQAGLEQAASWRPADGRTNWRSSELPDLMFPGDRSLLVSTLWDDDWTCIGGSPALIASLLAHPTLGSRARRVTVDQDATPPGRPLA